MTQSEALNILKLGKNVFLTGAAGSGKTFVLNKYVDYLKSHGVDVAVTASTGIAATHLSGQTIHSWSGLGVRDSIDDRDIDEMMQRPYLYKRFDRTKVIIIDEVSMLHDFRLDMIDWVCRSFKRNEKPFGGMQVIFCGDFFQLPPVSRGESVENRFAYKAESWKTAEPVVCYLSEQHRQKDDEYLKILNEIRDNKVSGKTVNLLRSRIKGELEKEEGGFEKTKLFTHNIDVDIINNKYLDLVPGQTRIFSMSSRGHSPIVESLKKSCLSPESLALKVGARVMFTKNDPEGKFVNGTLGTVSGWHSFGGPAVRTFAGKMIEAKPMSWTIEDGGVIKAEVMQYPLRLAWAITVHKSQGMSLDEMEVDLSKSFVRGMGYVALSRVRTLSGVKLLGFNAMSLLVDDEILEKDIEFKEQSDLAAMRLSKMSKKELEEKQNEFLRSIEPEEKIKIRKKEKLLKKKTEEITADFLEREMPLSKIADERKMTKETIVAHIEKLQESGKCPDIGYLRHELKKSEMDAILSAFDETGTKTLSHVYNLLSKQKLHPDYFKIRLARLFLTE
jgi:ATP-dependent exoDNAse (exonuclease V) alpha subunit